MTNRPASGRLKGSISPIWNDNWIPGLNSMRLLIQLENTTVQHVDELFVPDTRLWDEGFVQQTFIPIDAEEILKIRPGLRMEEDTIAWHHEKFGLCTVRSAYRLLKEAHSQAEVNNPKFVFSDGELYTTFSLPKWSYTVAMWNGKRLVQPVQIQLNLFFM